MFKKLVFAAAPLAVLGGFAAAGTANAAPLTYSDTSVSVASATTPVVDEFTGITTASTTGLTPGASLTLSAAGNGLGTTLTWTNATAVSTTDTATLPVPAAGTTTTVTVTDGTAKASVTIVSAADPAPATTVSLTLTTDTVTIPVATTDNTTAAVNFGTLPTGVTETLGNAPVGVALANAVLSATSAVPGTYSAVTVTATDGTATAVETLSITVAGSVVPPTPPKPAPPKPAPPKPAPPKPAPRPHLYNGHVIFVNNNDAEIGWNFGPGVTCALTRTFGYGFTVYGSPHQGFTCYNPAVNAPGTDIGYWSGLAAGHGYDIQLIPATRNAEGQPVPLPNAQTGWIYIHTTS